MGRVFIDTGAFVALFVKTESNHEEVKNKYLEYRNLRYLLITSEFVLSELYTRLIYDWGKSTLEKAIKFINESEKADQLRVLRSEEYLFKKSTETILKFAEHKLSFTDSSTYVFVKEFKLDEVFTLDSGFKKIGLKTSF